MLSTSQSAGDNAQSIIVRPNASLTCYHALLFFTGIALVSLIIGTRFLLLGAWVILPFALLEMLLLAFCLRQVLRSNKRMESIRIAEDHVQLTQQDVWQEQSYRLSRHWLRVIDETGSDAEFDWQPKRVLLRSHGQSHEIGSFVNNAEKKELIRWLRQALSGSSQQQCNKTNEH